MLSEISPAAHVLCKGKGVGSHYLHSSVLNKGGPMSCFRRSLRRLMFFVWVRGLGLRFFISLRTFRSDDLRRKGDRSWLLIYFMILKESL